MRPRFSEDDWTKLEGPEAPDPEIQTLVEQSEAFEPDESAAGDAAGVLRARRDAYFRSWYPEEASAEIWSKPNSDRQADAIEMALKEHFVHCRVEKEGGSAKVFVQPQDKSLARRVVQDIIKALG
jgi:hypothetical protein